MKTQKAECKQNTKIEYDTASICLKSSFATRREDTGGIETGTGPVENLPYWWAVEP